VIQTLHGLVEHGKQKPTPYRDGQNVIRHSRTGAMVYLPPEAKDVTKLMKQLVSWINRELKEHDLPVPVIAALAHYQFATVHPYFDGNGRTARLLTTLILHRGGYGLRGVYSLEEYYAKNLTGYYDALAVGNNHNYYMGRANADCSGFVEYFCLGMAVSFETVRRSAETAQNAGAPDSSQALRELDTLQRTALGLFSKQTAATAADLAAQLGMKPRNAGLLALKWVRSGFLEFVDASNRARKYRLVSKYEMLVAGS
jgi:Fic family protein